MESTTLKLERALKEVNAPEIMLERAREGYYDDFKSSIEFPQNALYKDAKDHDLPQEFLTRIKNCEFDCQEWEARLFWMSPEGQAVQQNLTIGRKQKRMYGLN